MTFSGLVNFSNHCGVGREMASTDLRIRTEPSAKDASRTKCRNDSPPKTKQIRVTPYFDGVGVIDDVFARTC